MEEQAEASRGWRWWSTPESVEALTVSVLAIVETLAAVAIYAWIAVEFGTLHLTISCCIAPFLLLRTPESTKRGLGWGLKLFRAYDSDRFLEFRSPVFYERDLDRMGKVNHVLLLSVLYPGLFTRGDVR